MNDWQQDKAWSDRFIPSIKMILGLYLIGEANEKEDRDHNTDLIVLKINAVRVACRIRRVKYLDEYGDQFTIRTSRPQSNMETELSKIIAGWGDYFFYGFEDRSDGIPDVQNWHLADLNIFRRWNLAPTHAPITRINRDGSSEFHGYKWEWFPSEFIKGMIVTGEVLC